MNPMPALIPMLKEILLSGILDSLEARNRQAIEDNLIAWPEGITFRPLLLVEIGTGLAF